MAANNMVPPMDPRAMAAMGMANPFAPPEPPPPSPTLGFQVWGSDPRNAMKIQPSMTAPDAPLQPNAGMASANPPQPPPMASAAPPQNLQGSASAPAQNLPTPPAPTQLGSDQAELQRLQQNGAGLNQIHNKPLRVASRIGDIAGSILAPGIMAQVPGTTMHNWQLRREQQGRIGQDQAALQMDQQSQIQKLDIEGKEAGLAAGKKATAKAAMEGTIVKDGSGKPIAWVDGDGVTHAPGDTAIPAGVAAVMSTDAGKPPTSEFELWHRQNPTGTAADFQKLQSKPLTAEQADSLNAVWNPLAAKHHLPSGQFQPGMSSSDASALSGALNNAIGKQQGDQHVTIDLQGLQAKGPLDTSDPAMQASVAAVANGSMRLQDVFGRGATTTQKAQFAAAVKQVNPQWNSGDNAVENESRRYMISGQGGQTITAGNTLQHHLDLYDKAVDAVKNGDIRLMNQIGNELGIQTGNDAQSNLALIRQGVAMEAARYYTGGVPGEAEVNQFNKSLSGDGSPQQMHGGANTLRAMARGKLIGLQGQSDAGAQGRPNFINPMQPPTQGTAYKQTATGPDGHKIGSNDGDTWFDVQTGKKVQ